MRDYNRISFTGHIGRGREGTAAIDFRVTPGGQNVARMRVASGRSVRDETEASGWKDETEWFNVVAFGELAERCDKTLDTGFHVLIEGRVQTRTWTDRDGNTRNTTEIIASDVILLSNKMERDRISAGRGGSGTETDATD